MMKILNNEKKQLTAVLFVSAIFLYFGWKLFWFLTDDAYISFRYISNSMLGHGYVWNPPPFMPVEGYSNFLWVFILDMIWKYFNILPPEASNALSLLFSYLTLITGSLMVFKLDWKAPLQKHRILFIILVLAATLTNRTFLAWTSSGLETAMFNFFITFWIFTCIYIPPQNNRWLLLLTFTTSFISLTRPDGLLFVAATLFILAVLFLTGKFEFKLKNIISIFPLLLVPIHILWRQNTYGEWLPNTYYAKVHGIWPESGLRYVLSFILEYGLWIWGIMLIGIVVKSTFYLSQKDVFKKLKNNVVNNEILFITVVSISTVLSHALYYIIVVGGDHFEYRVFSYFILLSWVSYIWMLNKLNLNIKTVFALIIILILMSYPIPWTHWKFSQNRITRNDTWHMKVSVSEHWPKPVQFYAKLFDDMQFWLIERSVCMRHQEHKIFFLSYKKLFPSRTEGSRISSKGNPILMAASIGIPAWVLPNVYILDYLGLNDYIIARTPPVKKAGIRQMAHDREPPEGYLDCFVQNVMLTSKGLQIYDRKKELTKEDICNCEKKWLKKIKYD